MCSIEENPNYFLYTEIVYMKVGSFNTLIYKKLGKIPAQSLVTCISSSHAGKKYNLRNTDIHNLFKYGKKHSVLHVKEKMMYTTVLQVCHV